VQCAVVAGKVQVAPEAFVSPVATSRTDRTRPHAVAGMAAEPSQRLCANTYQPSTLVVKSETPVASRPVTSTFRSLSCAFPSLSIANESVFRVNPAPVATK
jgi:hypothetical protein